MLCYDQSYNMPLPCYTKCKRCWRFGPSIEEHSTFHSKLKIKVEEYSTLVPKLQNSLITQNYSNQLLAVQTPYLHTCKFGQYNHLKIYLYSKWIVIMMSHFSWVARCIRQLKNLSCWMHPVTPGLGSQNASGNSRFRFAGCIHQFLFTVTRCNWWL